MKELYHTLEDMIAGSASSGSCVQSKNDVCAVSRRKINVAILVLGDKIIAINETSIEGMPHDQAMSLLRDDSLKILHLTLKKKELYKIKGRSKEVLFNNQVNSWLDQFQYIKIQTWLRGLGESIIHYTFVTLKVISCLLPRDCGNFMISRLICCNHLRQ